MWLHEAEDGTRHVLFPKGALGENWRWNVQGQPALQLSSEGGRCMTELETRLMDALSALSAQWETDQDQQAEEQGMLSARLDDLAQPVSDFAGQHEKQAAAL